MNYNKINTIAGWGMFAISLVVYLATVSPTASFWDCGEFIAVSNELQVPHPPGAPMYLLIGRLFAIFAPDPESIAYMVNLVSVFASAFTALFTFWIVTMLGKKILAPQDENPDAGTTAGLIFAGLVGGLSCTFADSVWFNAVEAEVYALSSFFTAAVVWLMLKWERRADQPDHLKWILLITYVMGLSVGVHLLNLLTIPALAMIYYFRKYKFTWPGFAAAFGISIVILGVINTGIIKKTFEYAWLFERFFTGSVNLENGATSGMGMAFGTGAIIFGILLIALIVGLLFYSQKKKMVLLNTALLGVVMMYLGISSYAMIIVRSQADPPINENNPSNVLNYLKYMTREQYGDWPILRGEMYNARAVGIKSEEPMYYKFITEQEGGISPEIKTPEEQTAVNNRYVIYEQRPEYEYRPGDSRFFPRMHSPSHYTGKEFAYKNYVSDLGQDPNDPSDDNPSGGDNLAFFWDYQVKYMYLRYFAWNFIGRAGDEQFRTDGVDPGLGSLPDDVPDYIANDESRNNYYFLPFLLGIFGLIWQARRNKYDAAVVGALFFFTGLAIILYLNQPPQQPRERDYSYAGSFQTYCIWIGLGVLALMEALKTLPALRKPSPFVAGIVCLLCVPVLMGAQNWNDHTRHGNYVAPDSAYNMLQSCAKNAILFTNGDNDTFPLWYLQEVENVRPDVRIVNLSLLNTDWYIHQLKLKINESDPLPITLDESFYMGERNGVRSFNQKVLTQKLPADVDQLIKNGVIAPEDSSKVENPMVWNIETRPRGGGSFYLQKQDLLINNLLNNIARDGWKRPIYFAITIPTSSYLSLNDYFQLEGMTYRVVPIKSDLPRGQERVNRAKMYKTLMEDYRLRGLNNPENYYNHDIKRMLGNVRHNYIRLAMDYVEEIDNLEARLENRDTLDPAKVAALESQLKGSRDTAVKIIDYARENIIDEIARIDPYYMSMMGRVYAEAKDAKKAKATLRESIKRAEEDIVYNMNYRRNARPPGSNDPNVIGLYMSFNVAKNEIDDLNFNKELAKKYLEVNQKIISKYRETGRLSQQVKQEFLRDWSVVFLFYKDDARDEAMAKQVAQIWQQLTGDDILLREMQRGRPRPAMPVNPQPTQQSNPAMQQGATPPKIKVPGAGQ